MTPFVTVISFVVTTTAVEFLFIQNAQSPSPSVDRNNNGILTHDILFALIGVFGLPTKGVFTLLLCGNKYFAHIPRKSLLELAE
jgi:hypothetical protein